MKNEISKEKRLEVYMKALDIYQTGNYPQVWLDIICSTAERNFGLCQTLRQLYTDQQELCLQYAWPDDTKWTFEDTIDYFPEFKAHWNNYGLTNEERIEILQLCIADLQNVHVEVLGNSIS